MQKHLKTAVSNYTIEEAKTHPISNVDAEIIVEIKEAARKLGDENLKSIIEEWKHLDDVKIRDMLMQWHLDNPDTPSNEEGDEEKKRGWQKDFVLLDGVTLDIFFIVSVGSKLKFDFNKEKYIYLLVINENTSENSIYHNFQFEYETQDERDDYYIKLLELLKGSGRVNFY